MNLRIITTLTLTLALSWLTSSSSNAADPPATPADEHLVMTAPRMKDLATAWAGCALGKIIQGPDMQPFRAELDKHDVGSLIRLRPWFGWDWSELADVPGNVTFKIFPSTPANAADTVAPQAEFVCVIWKEKEDSAVAACHAAGEAYFRKLGVTPTTRQIGNVACTVYTYKPQAGPARTTVYFGTDQYQAATTSIRGAELVLPRLQSTAEAFGTVEKNGLAFFAIEPLPLARLLVKPPAKGKRNYVKFFERQGGTELKLVRGSIDLPSQGALELTVNAELQGTFPLPKGLGILNYQATTAPDLNDYFGKSAHTIRHWSWDFPVAMKAVANLFDEWNEPGPSGEGLFDDLIDGLRDDPEGPQVDLRKGLFTQLGPEVKEVMFAGDQNKKPAVEHKLMLIACLDEEAVKQTLVKYYKGDKKVKKETVDGKVIWHVPPGKSLFIEGQSKSARNFEAATVSNKVLYLADDYQALLGYFAADAAAADVKTKARFAAVDQTSLAVSGATVGFRSLSLTEQAWRFPYEQLQTTPTDNEPANAALLRWLLFGSEDARPKDLGQTLPDWSKLAPLVPPTFNLLNPEAQGMRWQSGMQRIP